MLFNGRVDQCTVRLDGNRTHCSHKYTRRAMNQVIQNEYYPRLNIRIFPEEEAERLPVGVVIHSRSHYWGGVLSELGDAEPVDPAP